MIKVYHTPVTDPSSTDSTSTTASTAATNTVICWTCLGLMVKTGKEYILAIRTYTINIHTVYMQYVYIYQMELISMYTYLASYTFHFSIYVCTYVSLNTLQCYISSQC